MWKGHIMVVIPDFKAAPYKVITCLDNYADYLLDLSSQLHKPEFSKYLQWISFTSGFSRDVLKNKDYSRTFQDSY